MSRAIEWGSIFYLSLLLWNTSSAQSAVGVWTLQQARIGLDKKERWQLVLITQPRFTQKGWETILGVGKVGYLVHRNHTVFVGGQWVEFYDPNRFQQKRAFLRWQWLPSSGFFLMTTLENRWQDGRLKELLFRPLGRYRIGAGQFWLNLSDEVFLSLWRAPQRVWQLYPRQNRLWLTFSYPKEGAWQIEVGYLNITDDRLKVRHRLWIATRANLSLAHRSRDNKR
ncbi:MAG: DUF2490 domain-containing protein [Bacteroidia bacterium]|nr:DUF2490 domain-containing protein [Bacteroidia bacterium]MCX7652084.1 DUF2490 domain-containing protein [Bacteroidia bacterium]MDW8417111.1 DUF2490 domain-containing protein [Bacteroidia bacterium]